MHIRILDGNCLAHAQRLRVDHQIGPRPEAQAVEAMIHQMRRWRQAEPETLNVVLWDGQAQWRQGLAAEYRSERARTDSQRQAQAIFARQQAWIAKALAAVPVVQVLHPHLETGDLAYAFSRMLSTDGHLISLISSNSNWLQCVRSRVSWTDFRKREKVVDEYNFRRETGCASTKAFLELKAMTGDTSCDVGGLPGMKDSRAKEILEKWGTVAAFWKAAEDPFFAGVEHHVQANLPSARARVERNKLLLDFSAAPVPEGALAQVSFGRFSDLDLYEILMDLELSSLQENFANLAKAFETELTREQTALLGRAGANMGKAYPKVSHG